MKRRERRASALIYHDYLEWDGFILAAENNRLPESTRRVPNTERDVINFTVMSGWRGVWSDVSKLDFQAYCCFFVLGLYALENVKGIFVQSVVCQGYLLTIYDWCEDRHALKVGIAHSLIKNKTSKTENANKWMNIYIITWQTNDCNSVIILTSFLKIVNCTRVIVLIVLL